MGTGRKKMQITQKDLLMTSYHEGGHTLVGMLTRGSMPLHKVTILPRGPALGFTAYLPHNDHTKYTRRQMIANIDVAMGGRVAEELFYGNDQITTGFFLN